MALNWNLSMDGQHIETKGKDQDAHAGATSPEPSRAETIIIDLLDDASDGDDDEPIPNDATTMPVMNVATARPLPPRRTATKHYSVPPPPTPRNSSAGGKERLKEVRLAPRAPRRLQRAPERRSDVTRQNGGPGRIDSTASSPHQSSNWQVLTVQDLQSQYEGRAKRQKLNEPLAGGDAATSLSRRFEPSGTAQGHPGHPAPQPRSSAHSQPFVAPEAPYGVKHQISPSHWISDGPDGPLYLVSSCGRVISRAPPVASLMHSVSPTGYGPVLGRAQVPWLPPQARTYPLPPPGHPGLPVPSSSHGPHLQSVPPAPSLQWPQTLPVVSSSSQDITFNGLPMGPFQSSFFQEEDYDHDELYCEPSPTK